MTAGTAIGARTGQAGATGPAHATDAEQSGITARTAGTTGGPLSEPAEPTVAADTQQPSAAPAVSRVPTDADLADFQAVRAAGTTVAPITAGAEHPRDTTVATGAPGLEPGATDTTDTAVGEGQDAGTAANTAHTTNTGIANASSATGTTRAEQPGCAASPAGTTVDGSGATGTPGTTGTEQPPAGPAGAAHSTVVPEDGRTTASATGTTGTEQSSATTGPAVLAIRT